MRKTQEQLLDELSPFMTNRSCVITVEDAMDAWQCCSSTVRRRMHELNFCPLVEIFKCKREDYDGKWRTAYYVKDLRPTLVEQPS